MTDVQNHSPWRKDAVVVCPVYNESSHLAAFLERFREHCSLDALFINDGSVDGSECIIESAASSMDGRIEILNHTTRRGYGAALKTGFEVALCRGFKKVITIDADLQHRPEDIGAFLAALDRFDVVLGTRYMRSVETFRPPRSRYLINRYISRMIEKFSGVAFSDPFCGFRAYRSSFLRRIRLEEQSYGICLEMLLEIIRVQSGYSELPIELIYVDSTRVFLDGLDDPLKRLDYYRNVIRRRFDSIEQRGMVFQR
jgi:dolichol-phosphate mannosyltransferase